MLESLLYSSDSLNVDLFYAINGINSPVFRQAMLYVSMVGKHLMFPVYFAIFIGSAWFHSKQFKAAGRHETYSHYILKVKKTTVFLLLSYALYLGWVYGFKHLFHMPRPFIRLPEGTVQIFDSVRSAEAPYVSFPSGHSAFVMMMLAGLWPLLGGNGKFIGLLLLLWVGISRISLGVHFPSDVAGSWVVSLLVVVISRRLLMPLIYKVIK